MTRKGHNLKDIFQFYGALTVLMIFAALAQVKGAGPAYAKVHAVSALPGADNGGQVSGIREQTVASVTHPGTPVQRVGIVESYGRVPLAFETNQGQTDPQVKFVSRGAGYGLFLTTREAVLTLRKASWHEPNSHRAKALRQEENSAVLRMRLLGTNATATEVSGKDELSSKSNYFTGNDPKKWCTNIRQYAPGSTLSAPASFPSAALCLNLRGGEPILTPVGSSVEVVTPVTYALPAESTAMS